MIRPPLINGKNDHEKVEQIVKYLYILADEIRRIQLDQEEK